MYVFRVRLGLGARVFRRLRDFRRRRRAPTGGLCSFCRLRGSGLEFVCRGAPKEANAWVGLEPEVPWEKDTTIGHDDPVPISAVLVRRPVLPPLFVPVASSIRALVIIPQRTGKWIFSNP